MNIRALHNPKPHTEFRRYKQRLTLFHEVQRHEDYWREYWTEAHRSHLTARGREGDLGEFESLIDRYVPRDLPVLEAGCGPAHRVAALAQRGYDASGIDYEPEVIHFVQKALPDLDVRIGNVLSLEFPDGYFGCYLSIGVVEHFLEGPQTALAEARRVIHPQGVALISVPYLNPQRKAYLRQLPEIDKPNDRLAFHQYYYDPPEFRRCLCDAGFRVIDQLPYAVKAFLTREHPVFARLWASPLTHQKIKRVVIPWFSRTPSFIRTRYGHMMMFVARPI